MTTRFNRIPAIALFAGIMVLVGCRGEQIPSKPVTAPAIIKNAAVSVRPLSGIDIKPHPFLAPQEFSSMHAGGYNSDIHRSAGPLANEPQINSRQGATAPGGMYATTTFTENGLLIAFMGSFAGFELNLLEPRTMKLLARYDLPQRPSTFESVIKFDPDIMMSDTSSSYFYLDHQGYIVIADSRQQILRIGHRQSADGSWAFFVAGQWDMSPHVPHDCLSFSNWFPRGECDPITSVTPDHQGLIWWVTLHGRIGTLNPANGQVQTYRVDGETIQNSFAVADNGVFIVTDHALYGFAADASGKPEVLWREVYDRGRNRKVGAISQGSGTTPTLLGDDYVIIADNADPRVNLLVYRRGAQVANGERLVCKLELFDNGASAVEISMIAWGRSIITKNDYGYTNAFQQRDWSGIAGGFMRIDIRADESGCDIVWQSDEIAPSVVPKLSAGNGLIYSYGFAQQDSGDNAWYLIAMEAETGRTAFKILTGAGSRYDGNWGPLAIGPDGTVYVTCFGGMIAIWDGDGELAGAPIHPLEAPSS